MKYEIPTPRTGDSILQDLVEMLTDLTSDWDRGLGGPIGAKTRLVAALGFDSVDDVQVAIAIEEQFQRRKLPFEKLLMVDGR
jgi:acyl carrier protein